MGIIIYALFFKDFPYKGENQISILNQITRQRQKLLKHSNDKNFDDLIRKLLTEEQNKRITWEEYFNLPFLMLNQIKKIKVIII